MVHTGESEAFLVFDVLGRRKEAIFRAFEEMQEIDDKFAFALPRAKVDILK